MSAHWLSLIGAAATTLAQLFIFLRWLHRRMRDDEITRAFVTDIATNHLPHIYQALRQIAQGQGIKLDEPPLLRFSDLHDKKCDHP